MIHVDTVRPDRQIYASIFRSSHQCQWWIRSQQPKPCPTPARRRRRRRRPPPSGPPPGFLARCGRRGPDRRPVAIGPDAVGTFPVIGHRDTEINVVSVSSQAPRIAEQIADLGYTNVHYVDGGFPALRRTTVIVWPATGASIDSVMGQPDRGPVPSGQVGGSAQEEAG